MEGRADGSADGPARRLTPWRLRGESGTQDASTGQTGMARRKCASWPGEGEGTPPDSPLFHGRRRSGVLFREGVGRRNERIAALRSGRRDIRRTLE